MEVPKLPPLDPKLAHAGGGPMPALGPRASPEARPSLTPLADAGEAAVAAAVAALVDQVHIHPLDLNGAIQILTAEVRAELPLPGDAPHAAAPMPGGAHGGGARLEPLLLASGAAAEEPLVATAPQSLLQLFLQALPPPPETLEPAAWLAASAQVEGAMQVALDRAVAAVTVWRDVPTAVVEGANQTRAVVMAAITDETPNPLWLRPEWVGLAPRMERYWRRRRRARQRLAQPPLRDPDPYWHERDPDETDPSG